MTAGQSGWRFADGMTPPPRPLDVEDVEAAPAEAETETEQLLTMEASS
jgi:hypothetical protein